MAEINRMRVNPATRDAADAALKRFGLDRSKAELICALIFPVCQHHHVVHFHFFLDFFAASFFASSN